VKHWKKKLKTLKEGINNTANTKLLGTGGQTWRSLKRIGLVGFENFQSSLFGASHVWYNAWKVFLLDVQEAVNLSFTNNFFSNLSSMGMRKPVIGNIKSNEGGFYCFLFRHCMHHAGVNFDKWALGKVSSARVTGPLAQWSHPPASTAVS